MVYHSISDQCNVAIEELISRFNVEGLEEAFYIADLQEIIDKHTSWLMHFPRIQPMYALRCNGDPKVLRLLSQLGVGFECTSKGEIKTALNYGIPTEKILFNNPCKQISHIKYANNHDIKLISFDSELELEKIYNVCPDAKLFLCLNVDDGKSKSLQFGCDLEDVFHLLDNASRLNLDVVGINVIMGEDKDALAYSTAFEKAHQAFKLADIAGYNLQSLHINEGFYSESDSIVEISSFVNPIIERYFPLNKGIKVTADCGRSYVTSAFNLIVNVIAKRKINDNSSKKSIMYYLNDGLYGSFSFMMYEKSRMITPMIWKKNDVSKMYPCSLWGPTCDGIDCIIKKTELPEMNIGDWVLFSNMGAYTSSVGSNFNGMPLPEVFYMEEEKSYTKNCIMNQIPLQALQIN